MYVGIDIEEVKRFEKYVKDKDYLERVFAEDEISYCMPKKKACRTSCGKICGKRSGMEGSQRKI